MNTYQISVCIPCIEKHIIFLPRCIKSIAKQSKIPYEVIIVISNIKGDIENIRTNLELMIGDYRKKINIKIEYTKEKKYAGQNRNTAVEMSKGDIISFIDADDTMHPNRIEILYNIFKNTPDCKGVLHHFVENEKNPLFIKETFTKDSLKKYMFNDLLHFGHSSFRKSIFEEFKYTDLPRGQDVEFVAQVISKYLTQMYMYQRPLSYYISNDSSFWSSI